MKRKGLKERSDQDSLPSLGQQATLPSKTLGFNLIYYGEVYTFLPADVDRAAKVDKKEGAVDTPSKVLNPTDDLGRGTMMHEERTFLEANHLTRNLFIILERVNHAPDRSTTTHGEDDEIINISQLMDMRNARGLQSIKNQFVMDFYFYA